MHFFNFCSRVQLLVVSCFVNFLIDYKKTIPSVSMNEEEIISTMFFGFRDNLFTLNSLYELHGTYDFNEEFIQSLFNLEN